MSRERKIILTIDQGTTSTRALLYSFEENKILNIAQKDFKQYFPHPGWVEHDLEEIWQTVLAVCAEVMKKSNLSARDITALGITNQRETIGAWDKSSDQPISKAIVWQDRRTSDYCSALQQAGLEEKIKAKTGLPLDPYFSASKANWLLEKIPSARELAQKGNLCLATMDAFLIWRLTKGEAFVTDVTNACRTNLYNIHRLDWDEELLDIFSVPREILPTVKRSNAFFGEAKIFDHPIPIYGVAGDQQASLLGHAGLKEGMLKITYGTGAFLLMNTGTKSVTSKHNLLTTIAFQLENDEKPHYALEGSIFVAGSALKWLKDKMEVIERYEETEEFAKSSPDNHGVYLVPSFTGLGAPHWDPLARGAILGMTLDTDKKIIARAALESLAYQTHDIVKALNDSGISLGELRVDGGVTVNDWFLSFMANLLGLTIVRPKNVELTILGATFLAALGSGILKEKEEIQKHSAAQKTFADEGKLAKDALLARWQKAIESVRDFSS